MTTLRTPDPSIEASVPCTSVASGVVRDRGTALAAQRWSRRWS